MDQAENVVVANYRRVAAVRLVVRRLHQVLQAVVAVALVAVAVALVPLVLLHQKLLLHQAVVGYPVPHLRLLQEVEAHPQNALLLVSGLGLGVLVIRMTLRYGYTLAMLVTQILARYQQEPQKQITVSVETQQNPWCQDYFHSKQS